MPETHTQINYDVAGHALLGNYHDSAFQSAIDARVAEGEAGAGRFQSVVDQDNLNSTYPQEVAGVNSYFSARGLTIDPLRVVTQDIMSKAYVVAGEHPSDDVESAQGRNVHSRSVVIENKEVQELLGDDYLLGLGLHEAAHSLKPHRSTTITREVTAPDTKEPGSARVVLGGFVVSGMIKADLRRDTSNHPVGDFWEEAFADLTRVRGLRYLKRSHDIAGTEPKILEMGGVTVSVLPNGSSFEHNQQTATIPAEFATVAKTSAEGRNMVGIATPNLAAYALELLDTRTPGLYEDMEAATHNPRRQAEVIRKIESVQPGLYRRLRELEYTDQHFAQGLGAVVEALSAERQARADRLRADYESDEQGTISFGRAAEEELNLLGQYATDYVDGLNGSPKLAEGLVTGDPANWHSLRVTPENFVTFEDRLAAYKQEQMARMLDQIGSE